MLTRYLESLGRQSAHQHLCFEYHARWAPGQIHIKGYLAMEIMLAAQLQRRVQPVGPCRKRVRQSVVYARLELLQ